MEAYVNMLRLFAQPKEGNNQFKIKKQPKLPENQTVWKSNNQGFKEETFNQMGRKDRDRQPGQRGNMATPWLADQVAPYLHADKLRGTNGEQERPHNPMLQHGENNTSEPLAVKTHDACGSRRNCQSLDSEPRVKQAALVPL